MPNDLMPKFEITALGFHLTFDIRNLKLIGLLDLKNCPII